MPEGDTFTTEAPNTSSTSEAQESSCGAGATTDGTDGSTQTVTVKGVNLSLVKTTTTHLDGLVEEQRIAFVGYTNSVDLRDIDPQALFDYIQHEFF